MNFYRDQGTFRSFVGAIRADGGGDGPEDIMGGLKKTFWNLSWRDEASKVSCMSYICTCLIMLAMTANQTDTSSSDTHSHC